MLSSLSFLIHGDAENKPKKKLNETACLYLINKTHPVRDENGEPLSTENLRLDLENRIKMLDLQEFQHAIDTILEKLEASDEALYYFVLASTYRLPDVKFEKSLKKMAVDQQLITKINGTYQKRLYSEPLTKNDIPQLAWDISPVLDKKLIEKMENIEKKVQEKPDIEPVDEWGLISREFQRILTCEELLFCAKEGRPMDFFHLKNEEFWRYLVEMYQGTSSDLFQKNSMSHFYQSKPCRVENWNLTTTKTVISKHVHLGNLLVESRTKLKTHFVANTDNSLRLTLQKFIQEEYIVFGNYLEFLINGTIDCNEVDILKTLPKLDFYDLKMSRHRISDELFEIVSGYFHVICEMIDVVKNLNEFSPIILNEKAFVGSRCAPLSYSIGMWRRLNVILIRFIVKKAAGMMTSADAEIFDLLTDAGDVKMIRDPSIWQRLNPLKMELSKCIDPKLANRLVDLIIGYRFFVNDKKQKMDKYDVDTFAKSDIQDAEELELFSKSLEFEKLVEEILSDVSNCLVDFEEDGDELSICLELLIERLPTTKLVENYSKRVLNDSRRFFGFLKKFFTTAYIHVNQQEVNGIKTVLDRERMSKLGFDGEFLRTIGYSPRSTHEDHVLLVTPPEPLNVFVTEGITTIYSQVYTVMNMLQTALDAVLETHKCETLDREPRLRYAFFHMNTTVFAIRKNMLGLIEAAYETMMKQMDFEKIGEERSAHECLNICYRAHRQFMKEVASALMIPLNRGSTARIIKLMVNCVSQASISCTNGDAVTADKHYQQFLTNLIIFLDQCRIDRVRYTLYRSLEIGDDLTDGTTKSTHSSYSDDLSCRSY